MAYTSCTLNTSFSHMQQKWRKKWALPSSKLLSRNFLEEGGLEVSNNASHTPTHIPVLKPSPAPGSTQLRVEKEKEGDLGLNNGPTWLGQRAYLPWMLALGSHAGRGGEGMTKHREGLPEVHWKDTWRHSRKDTKQQTSLPHSRCQFIRLNKQYSLAMNDFSCSSHKLPSGVLRLYFLL